MGSLDGDQVRAVVGIFEVEKGSRNFWPEADGAGVEVRAEHSPDGARCEEIAGFDRGSIGPCLQADCCFDSLGLRCSCHLFCFGRVAAERPLRVDVLPGMDRGQDQIAVIRDPNANRHKVDVWIADEICPTRKGRVDAEGFRGGIGSRLRAGGDCDELQTRETLDCGDVTIPCPTAFSADADDANS